MPWRLVLFIIIVGLVVFFAGFNIGNVSDISFGFYTLANVPIFISLFVAYVVGTITVLPFAIGRKRKPKKERRGTLGNDYPLPAVPDDDIPVDENTNDE